jgi:hypothetical protein
MQGRQAWYSSRPMPSLCFNPNVVHMGREEGGGGGDKEMKQGCGLIKQERCDEWRVGVFGESRGLKGGRFEKFKKR